MNYAVIIGNNSLFIGTENLPFTGNVDSVTGHIVETEHNILGWNDHRFSIGRRKYIIGRHHQNSGFNLSFNRQRHMNSHLITVKVGIKRHTDQWMKLDSLAFYEHCLKSLHSQSVQSRSTV